MSGVVVKGDGDKKITLSTDDVNAPVVGEVIRPKVDKLKQLKSEANKLVSMANKRLRRLEMNGLTNTPAYQAYIKNGGQYFSVKGKDYNQLQSELARLRNFIDSQTSTVTGVNNYLKEMAKNTGIKYKNLSELRKKADSFFELSSKIEQYLRQVHDIASAIGYQKIWESINVYVKDNKLDLSQSNLDIDSMVKVISDAIQEYDTGVTSDMWYYGSEYSNLVDDDVMTIEKDKFKFFLDKDE